MKGQCSAVNMKGFSAARCALGVLPVCLLAHEAECGNEFVLGGTYVGWTNTANVDYNKGLSTYKIKIGDTLTFANYDTIAHSVVQVDKLGYNTCGEQGKTFNSVTIGPGIQSSITLSYSGNVYVICTIQSHCIQGMKVAVQVLNADGSVNATADAAEAPKANSALAMPGFSWTSQILIATVALVVIAIPVLA